MSKWFWVVLAIVVAGMIGIFALANNNEKTTGTTTADGDPRQILSNDHVKGTGQASVKLIEYGDFQCPGCGAFFPMLMQLETEFGDQIDVVFRHFPLIQKHPQAMAAHRAAEAAGKQGKFFEMHDMLYAQQDFWSGSDAAAALFESFAEQLELNMDQYRADVVSDETFNFISSQMKTGEDLGVIGTPTLFLNGEQIKTPPDYQALRQLVIEKLGTEPASN